MKKMYFLVISALVIGGAMTLVGFKNENKGILTRKIIKVDGSCYYVVKDCTIDTGDENISYDTNTKQYGFRYTGKAFQQALSKFVAEHNLSVTKITTVFNGHSPNPIGFFVSVK